MSPGQVPGSGIRCTMPRRAVSPPRQEARRSIRTRRAVSPPRQEARRSIRRTTRTRRAVSPPRQEARRSIRRSTWPRAAARPPGQFAALPVGAPRVREWCTVRACGVGCAVPRCRPLRRTRLAEVANPVVVGIRLTELIPVAVAGPAPPEPAARRPHRPYWQRAARMRHPTDRQRAARMRGPESGLLRRNRSLRSGLGGDAPAGASLRRGVVVLSRKPPRISLVPRPSRCHTDCYS